MCFFRLGFVLGQPLNQMSFAFFHVLELCVAFGVLQTALQSSKLPLIIGHCINYGYVDIVFIVYGVSGNRQRKAITEVVSFVLLCRCKGQCDCFLILCRYADCICHCVKLLVYLFLPFGAGTPAACSFGGSFVYVVYCRLWGRSERLFIKAYPLITRSLSALSAPLCLPLCGVLVVEIVKLVNNEH